MRPLLRSALVGVSLTALVAGILVGAGEPFAASADTSTATPTPSATPPASSPTPTPTSSPTAATTPSPTAAPAPAPVPSPAAAAPAPLTLDPELTVQNQARNHSMGSTIRQFDPDPTPVRSARSVQPLAAAAAAGTPPGIPGLDVSGWQVLNAGSWASIYANGARFVYVKATESTDYVSSQFSEQYNDSYSAGLIHGAYHFATPNDSSGAAQANWFLAHGGSGTNDGRTLPPLLDIEYNPYGATCYGLSQAAMVSWISDFVNTIHSRIGRWPAIYSTTNWWTTCTGNSAAFGADPLFIARYPNSISEGAGTLPAGWPSYTIWQYADAGVFPGDQDVFNGSMTALQTFGLGSSLARTIANSTVYLISGANKYPIASGPVLTALAPLGQVAYVSQTFLDQLTTQQLAQRTLRGPDGTIYFVDSGIKLPFGSCAMVTDYGGSCDATGYVQVSAGQIAAFATGPAVTNVMGTVSGTRYYVTGGQRREILDTASLTQSGLPVGAMNVLSNDVVSYLPFGRPVARDNVYVTQTGTTSYQLLAGGSAYPVNTSVAALAGLPSRSAGHLQAGSIAMIPSGGRSFTGALQATGASSVQVLGTGGLYTWPSGVGGAPANPVTVSPDFVASYAAKGSIQPGASINAVGNGTVYLVMPTDILPVGAWESLVALSGGKTPVIVTVPQAFLSTLPQGPVALTAGTLVRSPENATVYLVNGVTNKYAFSDFVYPNEAGLKTFSFTTKDRLDAYPTAPTLLGFGLQCGTQQYVSAGGSVHAVSSALTAAYPFTFVPLDTFTCALLPKGSAATAFILTPSGTIYQLVAGKKRPINSMARFQQLAAGQTYLKVVQKFADLIPTGPAA